MKLAQTTLRLKAREICSNTIVRESATDLFLNSRLKFNSPVVCPIILQAQHARTCQGPAGGTNVHNNIHVTIGLLWSKQKVGHLLFCFKNNRPSTLLLWTFGPPTRPASEWITQLPHQNWTIWVRNAWDFCPIFTSLIYVIIEPKIAPFPISRNCPTLRLASLDVAMAYPVFLQKLIWGHSHGQACIE